MFKRLMIVIGLELYALLLVVYELYIGVRTDEAKYLLDIPYPHPPLARWILSLLDSWQYQELFWRVVFATLMIQAVWFLLDLARDQSKTMKIALAGSWLLSAAVIYQAGSVMMAPLTALQGLVFLWLLLRGKDNTGIAGLIGLFWFISLFTAYQAVLYGPVVLAVISRLRIPFWKKAVLLCLPVMLLVLYTLTNPLAAASMVNHAGKDAVQTIFDRLTETAWVYALGGSIILGILGPLGILMKPKWGIIGSFLLVFFYIFLSRYDYYAILFTPLLVTGLLFALQKMQKLALPVLILVPLGTLFLFFTRPPALQPSVVPAVMAAIESQQKTGPILINGPFGHEWQHASRVPILRYGPQVLPGGQAVICLRPCPEMNDQTRWTRLQNVHTEVWMTD